ncbi:ATP-binding protein [Stenotrophomonas lactitubi]|uniref:ATP-binding protein n=1 Tax=Stenotrophomonas lactitubi TaxID=2045214 RepID=UPI0038775CD7
MASPSGSVLATLQRLQRQLLFGGGTILTVLLLAAGCAALWLRLEAVHLNEREALRRGQQTVDRYIGERRRAYVASLNTNATLWATQQPALVAGGMPIREHFAAQEGTAGVMAPGALSVPWLALSPREGRLPPQAEASYLGMVQTYSAYMAATVAAQDSPTSLISFAFEPEGRLFAVAGLHDEAQLLQTLKVQTREQALAALTQTANAGWQSAGADSELQLDSGRLRAYFGRNPFTGEDALVTQMRLRSNGTPFVNRLTFEPLQGLRERLTEASPGIWEVVDGHGNDVLRSFSDGTISGPAPQAVPSPRPTMLARPDGRAFVVSAPLHGIDWTLLRLYRWSDIWAAQRIYLLGGGLALAALLAALWTLLLLVDRRVLRPALEEAARVHESEALSRTLIETSPVGLCLLDQQNGQLILHNQALQQLIGDTAGNLMDVLVGRLVQRVDGQVHGQLFDAPSSDEQGPPRYLQSIVAASRYQRRAIWVCAVTDVTAQKETQQRLLDARRHAEQAQHDAEAADQAKTAFVAMISHEIRTPLSGVLGHLELLAHQTMPAALHTHVTRARSAADVLQGLVNDTLDLSRIEAGLMTLEPAPFDPRALLQQTATLFEPQASAKGLRLELHTGDALGPAYVADAGRLAQVINNLVGNAVKFTASGMVAVSVDASVRPDGSEWLHVEVRDTGPGIDAEAQANLFKPFVQVGAGSARQHGGSGLGLALCQRFTALLGGTLGVRSTLGTGSVFHVDIPARRTTAVAEAPPRPAPVERAHASRGHALLVDDSVISRDVTLGQLHVLGWRVTLAADGDEAWQRWREGRFDIVLTDLNMPRLDGYGLARKLRVDDPYIPIVALTANAMPEDAQRVREAGMTTLLLKPLDLASLEAALHGFDLDRSARPPLPPVVSEAVQRQMREAFLQTAHRDYALLSQALDSADAPAMIDLLHSFAGALAFLGETQAARSCQQAEQALRSTAVTDTASKATVIEAVALIEASIERQAAAQQQA